MTAVAMISQRAHLHSDEESHNATSGQGPVLLDIGGDRGALVLHVPAAMRGAEIEVSPVGDSSARQHVAALRREVDGGQQYAAVYSGLPEGTWHVWSPVNDSTVLTVDVHGGEVTVTEWPDQWPDR